VNAFLSKLGRFCRKAFFSVTMEGRVGRCPRGRVWWKNGFGNVSERGAPAGTGKKMVTDASWLTGVAGYGAGTCAGGIFRGVTEAMQKKNPITYLAILDGRAGGRTPAETISGSSAAERGGPPDEARALNWSK